MRVCVNCEKTQTPKITNFKGKDNATMAIRITHIRKPDRDDRYEAISHYGTSDTSDGSFAAIERDWLIQQLEDKNMYAYVSEDGNTAMCDIKDNGNIRFLQTRPDASEANNLLHLPPC